MIRAYLASSWRRITWARIIASISAGSTLSSEAWMRALAVSSAPQRMN
jgi:hypothetical protein